MKNKILILLIGISVFLAGCTKAPAEQDVITGNVPLVDTTQQSITDTDIADSDLGDEEVQQISSDMDELDEILS